jgi:hypothetical protein
MRLDDYARQMVRELIDAAPPPPALPAPSQERPPARRGLLFATIAAAGVIAVVVTVGVVSARRPTHSAPRSKTTVATAGPPTFARGVAAPVDASAPEPNEFFASIGAGGERTAVVTTATAKIVRYITPPSQILVRVSTDRRTIYSPSDLANRARVGCGRTWTAYDVATGTSAPAFSDLPDPVDVVASPDGHKVAYIRAFGTTGTTGCSHQQLVVRDVASGRERRWDTPPSPSSFGATIIQLNWSPDSNALTYELTDAPDRGAVWVLDINHGTVLTDGLKLQASDPTCHLATPRFRPGTARLLAAENCPPGRIDALVEFDPAIGAPTRTIPLVADVPVGVIDLAVDASGQHIVYVMSGGTAYVVRGETSTALIQDTYQVNW